MADKYASQDKVFAKLKGFPVWPAKIIERVPGKDEKYKIDFYGTHDIATVKLDQLFKYNDETKAKYGKPLRKVQFNEAMAEIEAELSGTQPEQPSAVEDVKDESKEEGDLVIDEGPPSLAPVLVPEVEKTETEAPVLTPLPPPPPKTKKNRGLAKRDSTTTLMSPSSPVRSPESQPPSVEIVSRSGRKIKPKRFADEEITTTPVTKKSGEDGSSSKRSKRVTNSVATKNAPQAQPKQPDEISSPSPPNASVEPVVAHKTKMPTLQGKGQGRLSPDISAAESKGPPASKASPKKSSIKPPVASENKNTASVRKSEKPIPAKSTDEKEEYTQKPLQPETKAEFDENELDKENSNAGVEEKSEMELSDDEEDEEEDDQYEKAYSPIQNEKKIRFSTKQDLRIELSFDEKNPNSKEPVDDTNWLSIASQNTRKLVEDLKEGDVESQDLINSLAESIAPDSPDETEQKMKLDTQLKLLRLEGEVIEIIGEIVGCLGMHSADCMRAIDLLDRLEEHKLNTLMLKKHPEVVYTVQKLRCYVGNVEDWGFTDEQKAEFSLYAKEIRHKAAKIYEHFQQLFEITTTDNFVDVFNDELKKFKEQVDQLPLKKVLGLTEENGELQELALDINLDLDNVDDGDNALELEEADEVA